MAAREGLGSDILLIGVTQLTSTSKEVMNKEILIKGEVEDVVKKYTTLALSSDLDGVVCSVWEVNKIDCITVTPGIRLNKLDLDDQSRVATPKEAKKAGSTYIVVGRTITQSSNPYITYLKIKEDFINE